MPPNSGAVLVSGGAGYIGSHVTHLLQQAGFVPVVVDSLVSGNRWAADKASAFRQGDIGDAAFIAAVCSEFQPVAALHFAAFIEVGESVKKPEKYFTNNRDKAKIFFDTLASKGVRTHRLFQHRRCLRRSLGILVYSRRPTDTAGQSLWPIEAGRGNLSAIDREYLVRRPALFQCRWSGAGSRFGRMSLSRDASYPPHRAAFD